MLFHIQHRTDYRYSVPVFLEPLTLRLRPRCDAVQELRAYAAALNPQPTGTSPCVDLDGNSTQTAWFDGFHDRLEIVTRSTVETRQSNPFGFLVTDSQALTLPLIYRPELRPQLHHYIERDVNESVICAFAHTLRKESNGQTLPFLTLLARRIKESFACIVREQGEAWMPLETLEKKRGACRDLTVLYIDACRCLGLAARFVSGYAYTENATGHDLHAWAEVYLPGTGWRGFDPSEGLGIADRHIAIAAGRSAQDANPVYGRYRGQAESSLTTAITLERVDASTTLTGTVTGGTRG